MDPRLPFVDKVKHLLQECHHTGVQSAVEEWGLGDTYEVTCDDLCIDLILYTFHPLQNVFHAITVYNDREGTEATLEWECLPEQTPDDLLHVLSSHLNTHHRKDPLQKK